MKRRFTVYVALSLCLMVLFTAAVQAQVTPPGKLPIVKEPITLKVLTANNTGVIDFATNKTTKWFEEQTGIKIEWEVVPDINVSKSVILNSGDYPDVFLSAQLTNADIVKYGMEEGVFLPLNDLIDQQGYWIKQVFEQSPYALKESIAPDGNIYALPQVNEAYHVTVPCKLWINTQWLDNLGLEMPTTTDEFADVLRAFRDLDANGNGDANDEIPLTGIGGYTPALPGGQPYFLTLGSYLFGGFINFSQQNGVVQPFKGVVDTAYDKEEFREALRYMAMLYQEGLIDPEFVSQERSNIRAKVSNESGNLVGAFVSHSIHMYAALDGELQKQYNVLPPLKGPNGLQSAPLMPFSSNPPNCYAISTTCKNPEAAFRFADFMYSTEATYRNYFGEEGVDYRLAEEGEVGINGEPALYKGLVPFTGPQNENWCEQGVQNRSNAWRLGEVSVSDIYDPLGLETRLYQASVIYREHTVKDEEVYPNAIFMSPEENAEYAQIFVAIGNYVKESVQKFIVGAMDLDKDWDDYVNTLNNIGLARYEQILQNAYDASGFANK